MCCGFINEGGTMKMQMFFSVAGIVILLSTIGCGEAAIEPPTSDNVDPASGPAGAGLFLESNSEITLPEEPHIVRARFVTVDLAQLLDESGEPKEVSEVTLNLFEDANYIGVIQQIDTSGGFPSWVGNLKGVEYSEVTMLYTSGVFIAKVASPQGIYEVKFVEEGLYRIIQIDQSKFPQGEG
jgi:hypothetical protein